MSLLDILAALPQFRSRRKAQDFIDELKGRGWRISVIRDENERLKPKAAESPGEQKSLDL